MSPRIKLYSSRYMNLLRFLIEPNALVYNFLRASTSHPTHLLNRTNSWLLSNLNLICLILIRSEHFRQRTDGIKNSSETHNGLKKAFRLKRIVLLKLPSLLKERIRQVHFQPKTQYILKESISGNPS